MMSFHHNYRSISVVFTLGFVLRTRNDDDHQQYDDTGNQAQSHPLDSQ
jgi:hypothetical protein